MQSTELSEQKGMEICENVGRLIVDEIESKDVWNKIEHLLENYLKVNNIDQDPADLTDKLEWSIKVKLKK